MKKFFWIFIISMFCLNVHCEEVNIKPAVNNPLTVSQNINYDSCTKIFNVDNEKLFYLTLASVSANRFNIIEIQSDLGYVIFSANRNKYLATIGKVDNSNSILKITPCNNIYNFPLGIVTNMFKYIDLNLTTELRS